MFLHIDRAADTIDTVDKKLKAFYSTGRKKPADQREKDLQEIRKVPYLIFIVENLIFQGA